MSPLSTARLWPGRGVSDRWRRWCGAFAALLAVIACGQQLAAEAATSETFVRLTTDKGDILIEMRPDLAPHHARNFSHLARKGYYDGTYFHRVIPGFMIQGGDPNTRNDNRRDDGQGGPTIADVLTPQEAGLLQQLNKALQARGFMPLSDAPRLKSEFSTTARHTRGAVSMARTSDPNSAGSQFFICVADVAHLDGQYTIFGQVVTGMAVADSIVAVPRDSGDNPQTPIRIRSARVIDSSAQLTADERAAWSARGKF